MDTIFLTVLSGTATYVSGQIAVKLIIDPVQEFKKTIGQISHSLIEHANVIANPQDEDKKNKTSQHLRNLSSQLQAHLYIVPLYCGTACIFRLPKKHNVVEASKLLLNLSNNLKQINENGYHKNKIEVEKISDLLGIFMSDDERPSKKQIKPMETNTETNKQIENELETMSPFKSFEKHAHNDSFVKFVFDHIRNIGLTVLLFAVAIWKSKHIGDGWIPIWNCIEFLMLYFSAWTLIALNIENLRHKLTNITSSKWIFIMVWSVYVVIFSELFQYLLNGKPT